ncbi:uncharacterized protein METZ01_LOCUS153890 [marine metagenome]|uniref:Uncharacterized protein n=1 Tax=marine metagenome TaxID=408172 RepID=A0A382AHQ8_9ZZZZ
MASMRAVAKTKQRLKPSQKPIIQVQLGNSCGRKAYLFRQEYYY